jgi:hypothetical protein
MSACAQVELRPSPEREYHAYGKTWKYTTVERYEKTWGFFSTHGIWGMKEDIEQFVYLINGNGEKVAVHEKLYALQQDGSYRKIECCSTILTQAEVLNFDQKLIVTFDQTRAKTTDCFAYPPGYPEDEKEPNLSKRKLYVTLFGEFDPHEKIFRVREFFPGASDQEFRAKLGPRPTHVETQAFVYSKRKPFACDPIAHRR